MAINFNTYNFDKLRQLHIMALLQFMGVPSYRTAGKPKAEKCVMLREVAIAQPDKCEQGINAIVYGKIDTAGVPEDVARKLEAGVLALLKDVKSDDIGELALAKINEATAGLRETLLKAGKDAVKAAAENYRPIAIKDNVSGKMRKVTGVLPVEFERMWQLASQRIPILLVGPAGCGKTFLSEKLAETLGLTYSDQSCSEGMSEAVFNGKLLPTGAHGAFEHHCSPFMDRYEKGGVMLLDEMDAGDPNLFTYINKAIANDSYTVVQRFKKPVCKKHKDFVLVAAANTFGNGADEMYVGRNQLDAATIDRFKVGMVVMDYSREVEQSLAGEELCDWAWRIRDRIRENRLRRIMSTRVIKDLSKMSEAYGWKKAEWDGAYFTGWTQAERNLVQG